MTIIQKWKDTRESTKHGQLTVSHTDKCLKLNPYYERRETAKYIIGHKIKGHYQKKYFLNIILLINWYMYMIIGSKHQ